MRGVLHKYALGHLKAEMRGLRVRGGQYAFPMATKPDAIS